MPWFTVDEAKREHAAEYAEFPAMVNFHDRTPIKQAFYSEKLSWDSQSFDPLTNVLARYHKSKPSWVFVESLTGGLDGRRSIAHNCLVRRYMASCNSWKASYRFVMAVVQELSDEPHFKDEDLHSETEQTPTKEDALWDLVFIRLTTIQEYGWHAGLEDLTWITDSLGDAIVNLDWRHLQPQLSNVKAAVTEKIIEQAQNEGEYFATGDDMVEYLP